MDQLNGRPNDPYWIRNADRLSIAELEKAKREVLQGWHGNGNVRRFNLGRWYQIIQDMVNGYLCRQDQYFRKQAEQMERNVQL